MAIIIEMPKLSDTMSEGKILSWMKKEGDPVSAGEVLAEIESDKSNMEMEAADSGYLRKILVPAGGSVPVGAPIAVVTEEANEDISKLLEMTKPQGGKATPAGREPAEPTKKPARPPGAEPAPAQRPAAAPRSAALPTAEPRVTARGAANGSSRLIASPLAYRMAAELGVDLQEVRGTGPEGRIVKRDILEAARRQPATAPASAARTAQVAAAPRGAPYRPRSPASLPEQQHEDIPLTSLRRIIGTRLHESMSTSPHFYVTVEVDMKAAMKAREQLNGITGVSVTVNDIIVKAVAITLTRHPALNASLQGDAIRQYESVDIGVAVALPEGIYTPVVRGSHLKSLGLISQEIKALAEKAKAKKLTPDDYKGGTFTVSNLGMFGVKHFTAIINPPEACILAVGAVEDVPVVENGSVVPGQRMALTLSSDHRVVDGAQAAQFLRDLRQILENPAALAL